MKKVFVVLLVLCFMPAMAESISSCPPEPQNNPWFLELRVRGEADAEQMEPGIASGMEGIVDRGELAAPSGVSREVLDVGSSSDESLRWGDDVLIMSHGDPTLGKLSTDQDEQNGDMYASLLVPHTGVDDSVYIYRSQDGGATWQYFAFSYSSGHAGGISDQEILVGHEEDTTWIYNFLVYDGSSGGIWVKRFRPDGSNDWVQIVEDGDSIENISVDRNIENPQHVFLAWSNTDGDIDMLSSSDYCETWGNHRNVASASEEVSVCAGGDGYVYIAYVREDTLVRVARYTNNLILPSFNFESLEVDDEEEHDPSVAAARTAPGSSQVAWVVYHHSHPTAEDIHYGYTTDGGSSWTYSPWPPTNTSRTVWEMRDPYVRVSYNSGLARAVATVPGTDMDSVVYAYSTISTPATWESREVHNDYRVTGEFGARVDYSIDCSGGYFVYRQYASPEIWCEAWDFSGIDDGETDNFVNVNLAPNPTNGTSILSYTVEKEGFVRIALFDISGRVIKSLLNESRSAGVYSLTIDNSNLPAGVYFIKVNSPDGVSTKAMTVIK